MMNKKEIHEKILALPEGSQDIDMHDDIYGNSRFGYFSFGWAIIDGVKYEFSRSDEWGINEESIEVFMKKGPVKCPNCETITVEIEHGCRKCGLVTWYCSTCYDTFQGNKDSIEVYT